MVVLLFAWLTVFCVGLCGIVSCVVVVDGVFVVGEVFFCGWLMVWVSASFPLIDAEWWIVSDGEGCFEVVLCCGGFGCVVSQGGFGGLVYG